MALWKVQFDFTEEAATAKEAAESVWQQLQNGYLPVAEAWELDDDGQTVGDRHFVDLEDGDEEDDSIPAPKSEETDLVSFAKSLCLGPWGR